MNDAQVRELWGEITLSVMNDPEISPSMAAQLALALPRGMGAGMLYLAVQHEFTQRLLDSQLRPVIMQAIAQHPNAGSIDNFAVLVDTDVSEELEAEAQAYEQQSAREQQHENLHTGSSGSSRAAASSLDSAESAHQERDSDAHAEAGFVPSGAASHSGAATQRNYASPPTTAPKSEESFHLNDQYRFDSFVIGQSNSFAHAAAVAVAESPAKSYNPLFIYGDSGLGKTHLLHAIGHYAMELFHGLRVRYVSSEDFTNDFINSIANNQGPQFQQRYRSVDILLVDDIQFLKGKAETQEAFFHTFNSLVGQNKQIVITSDVSPAQLKGFEDRMLSRFSSGLTTDIQVPDLETRIAILRKKCQRENIVVDPEILELIASKLNSNIRELEGSLNRVRAYASLNDQPIDLHVAQTVLKDIVSLDENEILPTDIVGVVANYFNLSVDDLYGQSRIQEIAFARQIAMYLCRDLTPLSLPKIGQLFGGRDHSTVIYAHKKITQLIAERRSVYNQVAELTSKLKHNSA